ncbi:hypothetical protein Aau02nite_25050 [Amorphoplanes auranticolor]|uniref:N-acetyltransferase domain-containing protein n=1 Tax=Actinoplanes auranticolor TaxID=47988 RepID=A0A919S7J1_9ACTN|nr:hypothetical protein Aau02nite_25050 [Actinoplanes auranticolor]
MTWAHERRPLAASLRARADRLEEWQRDGFGMWIAEVAATGQIIGHCGLQRLEGGDEVEVGYYLGRTAWGQGYATEAARAGLAYGFDRCGCPPSLRSCGMRTRFAARAGEARYAARTRRRLLRCRGHPVPASVR